MLCRGRALRPAAVAGAALGIDQRAQVIETVGGEQPGGDQLPEARLDFGFELAGAAHDVGKEGGAAPLQEREDFARRGAKALRLACAS